MPGIYMALADQKNFARARQGGVSQKNKDPKALQKDTLNLTRSKSQVLDAF